MNTIMFAFVLFVFWRNSPPVGHGLLIHEVSRSHTTTHYSRYDSSERVIISSHTPLPDNTQPSQQTDIHVPGGIRIHNPSKRVAADLRLRPRGHWDRRTYILAVGNLFLSTTCCQRTPNERSVRPSTCSTSETNKRIPTKFDVYIVYTNLILVKLGPM